MVQDRPPGELPIARSTQLARRARKIVPGGAQTSSKSPTQFVRGVSPTHVERAEGSHFWDVDGNEYVDYLMALGPIVLGYDYPAVTEAVRAQLEKGTMYSLEDPLHVEVAELFTEVVPCAEMVQFAKNGHDVTTLAAKVARAYTDKDVIATAGYHGWSDVWVSAGGASRGIPDAVGDYTERFRFNDFEGLEAIFEEHPDDVAAIVTTPASAAEPEDDFLARAKELANENDALLVFDEVFTGFRWSLGGAQEYYGVTPDLAAFAKGMANGYPISAVAGREDVMRTIGDDDFTFTMTYAGESLSLAATKASIEVMQDEPVHEHIADVGNRLRGKINDLAAAHGLEDRVEAWGAPQRMLTEFTDAEGESDNAAKSLFVQECHRRGVFFTGSHLPCYSHTDVDVAETVAVYDEVMGVLADAVERDAVADELDGEPIGKSLRERTGDE